MATPTAKITGIVGGVTMTLAEITLPDSAVILLSSVNNAEIALPLPYPIKVDPNTAILFTVAGLTSGISAACVHYKVETK